MAGWTRGWLGLATLGWACVDLLCFALPFFLALAWLGSCRVGSGGARWGGRGLAGRGKVGRALARRGGIGVVSGWVGMWRYGVGWGGVGRGGVDLGWGGVGIHACAPARPPVPMVPHAIDLPSHTATGPSTSPANAQPSTSGPPINQPAKPRKLRNPPIMPPPSGRRVGRCACVVGWSVAWLVGWLGAWLVGVWRACSVADWLLLRWPCLRLARRSGVWQACALAGRLALGCLVG